MSNCIGSLSGSNLSTVCRVRVVAPTSPVARRPGQASIAFLIHPLLYVRFDDDAFIVDPDPGPHGGVKLRSGRAPEP